jgi:type VI secretion system protein VasG
MADALRPSLLEVFPAALLGRMTVVPYRSLNDETMGRIIRLQLDRIKERIERQYDAPFTYDDTVVELVRSRCNEVESGGRVIDAVLMNTLVPRIGRELLLRMLDGGGVKRVSVTAANGDFVYADD